MICVLAHDAYVQKLIVRVKKNVEILFWFYFIFMFLRVVVLEMLGITGHMSSIPGSL